MTVQELFEQEKIDRDFIDDNFDGGYWDSCGKFVKDKWTTDIETLSPKQGAWLTKILDDCVEKRIEG